MFRNRKFSMKNKMGRNRCNLNNANVINNNLSLNSSLKEGDSGKDVENLQRMLLGIIDIYPNLPIVTVNGIYGSETKNAVERFQEINNIKRTGITDINTYSMIKKIFNNNKDRVNLDENEEKFDNLNSVIKKGSKGNYVRTLQEYLNKIAQKYTTIPIIMVDGIFGDNTNKSVTTFQNIFELKPDGIVGEMTWKKLNEEFLKI